MKIKNFFSRIIHWFGNNVWIQLVLLVGGIFTFIFALPKIVNKIKNSRDYRKDPDYFYTKYQVTTEKIDSLIDELQQKKNNQDKKIIMFTPKKNSVASDFKNSLANLMKEQKIDLKVVFVEQETFPTLYQKHFDFFKEITLKDDYFNNVCDMKEIKNYDDFLQNPILILFEKNEAQRAITNLCGNNDYHKNVFLEKFWNNQKYYF